MKTYKLIAFIGFLIVASAIPSILFAFDDSQKTIQSTSTPQTETVHYVTLEFTQASFSLSISQHIKDHCNSFSFTFPTTKKFYDSVKEGQEISAKFKTATFILSGNIGKRKVIVEKKFTKQEPIYTK